MFKKLIPLILKKYDLKYQTIYPAQTGYRNSCYKVLLQDGRIVNVIIYKDEPGIISTITRANEVSRHASTDGLPTRTTESARTLRLSAGKSLRYVSIYN